MILEVTNFEYKILNLCKTHVVWFVLYSANSKGSMDSYLKWTLFDRITEFTANKFGLCKILYPRRKRLY